MPIYINPNIAGITETVAKNDGSSIMVRWATAYASRASYKIAYLIFYSENERTIFSEGAKFFVFAAVNQVTIPDLTPGVLYHFAVRAVEYDPNVIDFGELTPIADNLYAVPTTLLASDISSSDTTLPVVDTAGFPSSGMLKIGVEVIRYSSLTPTSFVLASSSYRGYLGTTASSHTTDGYDGYATWDTTIPFFFGYEETNPRVYQAQSRFDIDHHAYTPSDGYKQKTQDLLSVDLTSSDASNVGFQQYDYAGWHQTDPTMLLTGECVGSYIGGEQYCVDGEDGVGRALRGLSVQEQNNQRQEMLLEVTGEPIVLLQKQHKGIVCSCYLPSSESPDDRCTKCFGTGFVVGWQQYYNPRRSDGRILVRFGPSDDDLKRTETGLESEVFFDCWTLTVPTIKDRDVIIRFDQDGNEEFRYEVLSVTRNRMLQSLMGGQKFKIQRIRKTDPAYQIRAFRNTAKFPEKLLTKPASAASILPHTHSIVVNEGITSLSDINQTTSVSAGHSHSVVNGVVQEALGHTHEIII